MSTYEARLQVAALAWAKARRARVAATSVKRKTREAARGASCFSPEGHADSEADKALAEARAAERAADKNLLAVVDPKPIVLRARVREVEEMAPMLEMKDGNT